MIKKKTEPYKVSAYIRMEAAQLIGIIQPISRFRSYSALHSYAGMDVIEMRMECKRS